MQNKIYSKREISELMKNISKVVIISDNGKKYPKEKFLQIQINSEYIPYIISSYGRVFSINYKHRKNRCTELKYTIDKDGYPFIVINYNNKSYGFNIHRLVALNFIKIPKKYIKKD